MVNCGEEFPLVEEVEESVSLEFFSETNKGVAKRVEEKKKKIGKNNFLDTNNFFKFSFAYL